MDESDDPITPIFSCMPSPGQYHLHTYAPADNILYNLGLNALTSMAEPKGSQMSLTPLAAIRWTSLNRNVVRKKLPTLKIRIPGGRLTK
jgi:hypothetical protein